MLTHYSFFRWATWRSGYAAACKAVYTGSIPVVASCALAACGSGSGATHTTSHTTTTPAPHASTAPPRPAHKTPAPPGPRVGTTQNVHTAGTTLSVKVLRVLDPLLGSGAALEPGTRAVGVMIQIQNNGPGIYDSSATGDVSVVPSVGTPVPVFAPQGACQTPLRDFDNYITEGEVRQGCVVFAVDSGAKLLAVRFSPHGQPAGRVTWATAGA